MFNNVDCNVVRRNTIESDFEKMGVSTLILINPSVRTLALLQLESSEGEPYTS